ncbi:MAG: hypothetical protein WD357_05025 [Gracilimonas sp.]
MKIEYQDNKEIIESFYHSLGLANEFDEDNVYLRRAFNEIKDLWIENFNKIDKVRYLLIAEAPLWGQEKKYIYNPKTNNSQFFYRSDLETILNTQITHQEEFINTCNEIGLLVVDISPFPLNTKDTKINYSKNKDGSKRLTKNEYRELVGLTIPTFFERKIKLIGQKKSSKVKAFFRYARVENAFSNLISNVLIENGIIAKQEDIGNISQAGGGIDRVKLSKAE